MNDMQVALYEYGDESINVNTLNGEVYLSSKQMQQLYEVSQPNISVALSRLEVDGLLTSEMIYEIHISSPYQDSFRTQKVTIYPMEAWLYIGMRARSARAIVFQRWAAGILKAHLLGQQEDPIPAREPPVVGVMYLLDWAVEHSLNVGRVRMLAREGMFPRAYKNVHSDRWLVKLPAIVPDAYFGPMGGGAGHGIYSAPGAALAKLTALLQLVEGGDE